MTSLRFVFLYGLLAVAAMSTPTMAQVPPNCTVETVTDPERQVLSCEFGVVIEMEAAAQMGFAEAESGAQPGVIDLERGAVLIEADKGEARPQIRTPHAIAAVRGTTYLVDVTADRTSVFVVEGEVSVLRTGATEEAVVLGAGDGVDVDASDEALEGRTWPADRAAALLARFGR
ncbi:FecR family protein [Roseobacter sinensis]|uniref:FecR family protein n=1 Tax=Roseobacter sinensis TaxID=2931391 RepID=A0ABT3BB19_9RHOB|nr:FecR family protein [Roseobacter sp. WL0113]MCV3270769.1 FecR family protein [Roseobacter sp. WL0113]